MNLLVTGGAGFIGANFVNYWIQNHSEDTIIVLDKLTYAGNLDRLSAVKSNSSYSFIQGDILCYKLVCDLLRVGEVDTIVHFAAESHVDRSLSGLEAEKLFNKTNLDGTITLLHAALKTGVKKFHHVSTDEVYGDLGYGEDTFHENYPYDPHNPYAISKAAADFAVRGFSRSHGLEYTISNCTNNYGPYQMPEKMIPRSILFLLQNKKIELYTNELGEPGQNIRDWIFVEDHCRALESIILEGKSGETYCIGGNSELSNLNLVKKILSIMSKELNKTLFMNSHVKLVKDRPGHDIRYAMNIYKMKSTFGWSPIYSFDEGFEKTVKWYTSKEGRKWLKSVKNTSKTVRKDQGKGLNTLKDKLGSFFK